MDEAKAIYEDITDYALLKMYEHGLDPDEVTENYKRYSREVFIFDHLTGDVTPAGISRFWTTAKGRLTFWRYQFQRYSVLSKDSPELTRYIIDRLKEATRGI